MIKSARRVFEVFELFAERRRSASVAEVVKELGYPQSSTSMLLRTLTKLRYLEYDRHARQYVPTLRIALLGSWIHDQVFSETGLARLVEQLHADTGAVVILGMQNDIHVQYIHMAQAFGNRLHWYIKPGSVRPLCRSAVGRVLLSQKTDVDVIYLLRRINAEEKDSGTYLSESALLQELDIVGQQGYAYTAGTVNPQAGVIEMQLPTPASQPDMAIGIGATRDRTERPARRIRRPPQEGDRTFQGRLVDGGAAHSAGWGEGPRPLHGRRRAGPSGCGLRPVPLATRPGPLPLCCSAAFRAYLPRPWRGLHHVCDGSSAVCKIMYVIPLRDGLMHT
jgi:DNA-binding IclR family transcriptional regulator